MLLSELLSGCETLIDRFTEKVITDVVSDSRKVTDGSMFIALRGDKRDGNAFVREALQRGAAAVVSDGGICCDGVIPVKDADAAEAIIYSNLYSRPADGMRIAAVTGTNGKTSTVSAAAHILRTAGVKVGVIGGVELSACGEPLDREAVLSPESSTMTTPDTKALYKTLSIMRDRGCNAVVMEASSHALSRKRLSGMKVFAGAFTNLSPEHLDHHVTMEKYFEAKRSLADISDRFVTNCDDVYGRKIFRDCKNSLGISAAITRDKLFATAENVVISGCGSIGYDCVLDGKRFRVESPVCGRFSVYNTLAASATAYLFGAGTEAISVALSSFHGAPGRMETVFSKEGAPSGIIDYAHTPDALEKVLRSVREDCGGRVILVFGCGGDRDRSKRAPMGEIACRTADHTIVTGDNPRGEDPDTIIEDIVRGFFKNNYEIIPDRRDAIIRAVDVSAPGDIIICCGKGHEKYIIDKRGKHFFDEKKILVGALEKKYRTVEQNEGRT